MIAPVAADHDLADLIWTCSSTPDRARPGRVLSDVMVEMRDGISLATDVYLPDTGGPFATVMIRLPYGKTVDYCGVAEIARHWNRKGYAFVGQDCRGTYGSGGVFDPAHPYSEAEDGHDTVAWIAEQPWSSGRVALTGESYYSLTSFAAASIPHPALACIVPGDFPVDRFDGTYRNGCLRLAAEALWAIWWMDPLGHPVPGEPLPTVDVWHLPTAGMARAAGLPNHYLTSWSSSRSPARATGSTAAGVRPTMRSRSRSCTSAAGMTTTWASSFATGSATASLDTSGGRNFLMIGPWSHEGPSGPAERVGIVPVVEDGTHRWDRMQAFYDRYLMGLENGFEAEPPVSYFVIGADEWRRADTWPPPGSEPQAWYLHGAGELSTQAPGDEEPDTYAYDPADPVAWTVSTNPWTFGLNLADRRPIEARPDVLVYTSAPLPEPVEVIGDMSARLYVSSDAVDTDFTAALVDVFPDGAANLIQDGILRMGLREPERGRQLLEPGRPYEVEIDLWAIAYRVPAGHRLRVEISSSEFDRYDRNLNTAALPGEGSEILVAHQTVFHDAARPSHVSIPVRPVPG